MTHTTLPPISAPNGPRPAQAEPRLRNALGLQVPRHAPPPLEPQTENPHNAVVKAATRRIGASPMKMSSQSLPSLNSSQGRSASQLPYRKDITSSTSLSGTVAGALHDEEKRARAAITATEDMNRLTFNLVKSRSTIVVIEEPQARWNICWLFSFGSCQIRLTQVIKIQRWWRLLLRNSKSWHLYTRGALRMWHRRTSDCSQSSSASLQTGTTGTTGTNSRRQSQRSCQITQSTPSTTPRTPADISAELVRLEKAATSPTRYHILMDEYLYTLSERANILLLLERRRSVDRHKKLYYNYLHKCAMGIPEDNLSWQERFVAEMFVAIVHFKALPYGWRPRYKLPYPAWRALRWRTLRIVTPPPAPVRVAADPAELDRQRRQRAQEHRAARNDLASHCDHARMTLVGQEHHARQDIEAQFKKNAPTSQSQRSAPCSASEGRGSQTRPAVAAAPRALDQQALTPLPPSRSPRQRTLPPLSDSPSSRRPRTTQPSVRRPLLPLPRGRPVWATVPLNSTPVKMTVPQTEQELAMARLRQAEKDMRMSIENHEYDARYRLRWLYANKMPTH